jgi:hypothetical protein
MRKGDKGCYSELIGPYTLHACVEISYCNPLFCMIEKNKKTKINFSLF